MIPAAVYGAVEIAVQFVVKGEFPLLANGQRNLAVPFQAMVEALRSEIAHINTSHLGTDDIALLEFAALGLVFLAGLAVLLVTTAPVHERLAFVFFTLQLGLLSSQIWAAPPATSATGARSSSRSCWRWSCCSPPRGGTCPGGTWACSWPA